MCSTHQKMKLQCQLFWIVVSAFSKLKCSFAEVGTEYQLRPDAVWLLVTRQVVPLATVVLIVNGSISSPSLSLHDHTMKHFFTFYPYNMIPSPVTFCPMCLHTLQGFVSSLKSVASQQSMLSFWHFYLDIFSLILFCVTGCI